MGKECDKNNRKTKYTHRGQQNDGTRKGWSLEGKKRFKTIFTNIKIERERLTSKEREERLLKEWRNEAGEQKDTTNGSEVEIGSEEEQYVPMTEFDFD